MDLKKVLLVLVAVLLAAVVAGCGGVSEKVGEKVSEKAAEKIIEKGTGAEIDIKGEDVTVKTKEGNFSVGAKELPDGFPKDFPVYNGAEVEGSMTAKDGGKTSMIVTFTTKDDFADVVGFYKDKKELGGYVVDSTLDFNDVFTVGLKKGEADTGSVMVGKNDNNTSIVITLIVE